MDAVADPVPTVYLTMCLWPSAYLDDSTAEVVLVTRENLQRHKDCYKLHNELVKLLIQREKEVHPMGTGRKPPKQTDQNDRPDEMEVK